MCKFNVHQNKTADGTIITLGMEVVTNEWRKGTVVADTNEGSYCCEVPEHTGQFVSGDYYFTDHTKRECEGFVLMCHHDHWFTVEYASGGRVQMNGERLGARIPKGVK